MQLKKKLTLLLVCAVAFAADTSDLKLKFRETERDYYLALLQISQMQAKALDLQNQIAQQFAELSKTCEDGKMDRQTLACQKK